MSWEDKLELADIIPWGRSFGEYQDMFALTDEDLAGRILGCGDGPASFNAEAAASGIKAVSVDPIYAFSEPEIGFRIDQAFATIIEQSRRQADRYVWDRFSDPDHLGRVRRMTMRRFLQDYEAGRLSGRYVAASLPNLPFADRSFDMALCSHLLFLYSQHLSLDAHIAAALEMLRVASEVRIFPLLTLRGERSPYIAEFGEALTSAGIMVEETRVSYEFQKGANTMFRLFRT